MEYLVFGFISFSIILSKKQQINGLINLLAYLIFYIFTKV